MFPIDKMAEYLDNKKTQYKYNTNKCTDYLNCRHLGFIVCVRPANERRWYFATTSLIDWVQAWNQPSIIVDFIVCNRWSELDSLCESAFWEMKQTLIHSV